MNDLTWVQKIRSPSGDCFFSLLNFFDTEYFYFILIPAFWAFQGWKFGIRLFYILVLSTLLNLGIKEIFQVPRPFQTNETWGVIEVKGFSFPSGAAQTAMLLSWLLIHFWKSLWKWPLCILYTGLISFSRVYLGVHYPIDILGGWTIGALLGAFICQKGKKVENFVMNQSLKVLFFLNLAFSLLVFAFSKFSILLYMAGGSIGLFSGIYLSSRKEIQTKILKSLLRASVLIIGIFALFLSLSPLMRGSPGKFILSLGIGIWIALGNDLLIRLQTRSEN